MPLEADLVPEEVATRRPIIDRMMTTANSRGCTPRTWPIQPGTGIAPTCGRR
jgi:hypothetical protein